MLSRDRVLIGLLTFLIFLLASTLYLIIQDRILFEVKAEKDLENTYSSNNVAGVESVDVVQSEIVERKYPEMNICYQTDCYNISSNMVSTFYQKDILQKIDVYSYISEFIVPYFEALSGGKTLVKNSKGSFYAWKEDRIIDLRDIYDDIIKLLEDYDGEEILTYELVKKDLPSTDGKYSDRYIEVDNSRQKLYAWLDGRVIKEIYLSAAKWGYEVYGVFPIVDKGIQPVAPGGKYMPYWMAFYYSSRQNSWYGLHGLVWWYSENGNVIYESENNIGLRKSYGCIRMLKDDAKYLYDRYEIGDPVLIHQ